MLTLFSKEGVKIIDQQPNGTIIYDKDKITPVIQSPNGFTVLNQDEPVIGFGAFTPNKRGY